MNKPPVIPHPRQPKGTKTAGIVVGLGAVVWFLFLYGTGHWDSPEKKLRNFLSDSKGLARLPDTITNVEFYQWNGLFTGETFARFEASEKDVRAFVEGSRELSIKPEDVFNPDHQLLPDPQNHQLRDRRHVYF